MGRQFRFYILPLEIDLLLSRLKAEYGLHILSTTAKKPEPVVLESAIEGTYQVGHADMYHFDQRYLVAGPETKTPMWFNDRLNQWHINSEQSEVIELSLCDYGSGHLGQGRLYYQKDMLSPSKDAIIPKGAHFVAWAEAIFRSAKKQLKYARELDAYIGQEADAWRQSSGRFITGFHAISKKPIYAETHD